MTEQAPEVITATPPAAQKKEKDPKRVAAGQALAAHNRAAKEEQLKRMEELVELERRHAEREAAQAAQKDEGYLTKNQLMVLAGVGAGGLLLYAGRHRIRKWLAGWCAGSDDPMSRPVHTVAAPAPVPAPTPKRAPAQLFNQSSAYN